MKIYEIICEGGNVQIGDKEAQQIDLRRINRNDIVPILNKALLAINSGYKRMFKTPLWSPELLASGEFLSGSSIHFFNLNKIPTDKFIAKKQLVGDIDTQVDINLSANVTKFLDAMTGKTLGPATLVGYKSGNDQCITLCSFDEPAINIQIDLEFVDYENNKPSEWSAFSHSSEWADIEAGIKGVFHKYLLRSLDAPSLRDVIILSGKKETPKVVSSTNLAFSVTHGLRTKLTPVMDGDQQREIDGLLVYKEIPTKDSVYATNLKEIARIFFSTDLSDQEMKQFWSFIGVLGLIKQYYSSEVQAQIIMGFARILWGKGAQMLYRDDPARDMAEKTTAFTTMTKTLAAAYDKTAVDSMRKEYYSAKS